MPSLADADATWGITGPGFLGLYAVLAIAAVAVVGLLRALARRPSAAARRHGTAPYHLDGARMAYLAGGPSRAIAASLAGLHAKGAAAAEGNRLRRGGELPADATPLDVAVYRALANNDRGSGLIRHRDVAEELTVIATYLHERGLLVRPSLRRWARNATVLLYAVVALGVVRLVAGVVNGRPVGFLAMLVIVMAVVSVALTVEPVRLQTPRGSRHLRKLRSRHKALRPDLSPATDAYGAATAATAVGLFGTAMLWQSAPEFAAATGITNNLTGLGGSGFSGGGGSYNGSTYSSSGGGGDGGGGGGCGG